MKYFIKLSLLTAFSISTFFVFAQSTQKTKQPFKDFRSTYGDVIFSVDPRIELYHAVLLAAGIPMVNHVDIDYKQKVHREISKNRNHPLFAFMQRNLSSGKVFTSIDEPIRFLLHLTPGFEWRKDMTYPDKQNIYIDSFRYYLKRFAAETDYARFFNSNADFYNIALANLKFNLENFNEKERMLNYYGVKDKATVQFNLVLNFFGLGNFGPGIHTTKGRELYALISPEKSDMRMPTFDQVSLYKLLWHEFGHSFANPAVQKQPYLSQIEALSHLHAPIKESMQSQAYATWASVIWEHLTEAVACRLAAQKFGEAYADLNIVRHQKGKRWIYLNPLIEALKEYEQNRTKYATFEDFMPQIVLALKNVTPQDIDRWMAETEAIRKPDVDYMPLVGDIFNKDSIMIILSSNEQDKAADERLKAFVTQLSKYAGNLSRATVVADTAALKMDLSRYNLFVIGTPSGNSFMQKVLPLLPIQINENGIIGEKKYEGKGYALLAGWVNPYNAQKIMTVMTALNPDDLVNFNNTPFGFSNYQIIKDLITYKAGAFQRNAEVWLAK
jgi:hypothetical protein